MATYSISSDNELKLKVRSLTGYADDPDELPEPDLDAIVDIAKLRLKSKTGSTTWYSDDGLGQALLGVTAILAKSSVENYSVDSWTIGNETVDVTGSGDDTDAQFQFWNEMILEGINSSPDGGTTSSMRNTSDYIGR